jgi:hypothetical protein
VSHDDGQNCRAALDVSRPVEVAVVEHVVIAEAES